MTYQTEAAAAEYLTAEGFKFDGKFWSKRGMTHGWDGGHMSTTLVTVIHNRVAPEYNSPDYYTLKFH